MALKQLAKKVVKKSTKGLRKSVRNAGKKRSAGRINRATGKKMKIKKEVPDRGIVVVDEADVLFDADLKSMFKRQAVVLHC